MIYGLRPAVLLGIRRGWRTDQAALVAGGCRRKTLSPATMDSCPVRVAAAFQGRPFLYAATSSRMIRHEVAGYEPLAELLLGPLCFKVAVALSASAPHR